MATIPLPALHVNTDQQSPLALYAQAQQIRNAQQQQQLTATEVQQRQIQLQDQQATTAAMKEWDGKNPDDLPPLVLKNGGSSTAVFGLKNQILDWKTKAANLNKDQLDNLNKTNDIIAGHFEAVKSAKPEDKAGVYTDSMQDLQDKGLVKPGQFPAQYPGDDVVDMWEKQHMGQKAIVEQAQKDKEVAAQTATAQSRATTAQASALRLQAELPGGALRSPEQKEMDDFVKNPPKGYQGTPQDFAKWKASLNPQAQFAIQNSGASADQNGNPSEIAKAIANKQMAWKDAVSMRTPMAVKNDILKQVYKIDPNFDTSEFGLEQDAAKKARSGAWADTRLAYNTALDHSDLLLKAADALDNGNTRALNSLENNFKTAFGWSGKIDFNAIANAYNHEVTSVVSKGHITNAEVDKGGATLPDDVNSQTIHDVVNSYKSLMNSKRDELDKIIKAGAGNKAAATIATEATNGGSGSKVMTPAQWLEDQKKKAAARSKP